jgi:hypothetical protein
MAGETNGRTRLAAAVAATRATVAQLPPNDVLSVGGFSDELRWWTRGKPVKEFALGDVPTARGPTNLDAALRSLVPSLDRGISSQVVLLTDGQVELRDVEAIAAALKEAGARLHVLAIGRGPGLPALRKPTETTGGTFAEEVEAAAWAAGLMKLLRQVSPRHWNKQPVDVQFEDLPAVSTAAWNRTWLRNGADELARTSGSSSIPMAAQMNVGSGNVAAVAFRPPDAHVKALAARVQSPPRDPRLNVIWRTGRRLIVDLDAVDGAAPINGLSPILVLSTPAGATETVLLPQTGPGRYVLNLPAPRSSVLATIRESDRIIDRFAVAGRYPEEFDGVGNDRDALSSLARRTGGRVVEPADRGRLSIRNPRGGTDLAPAFATLGGVLVGLGLVTWRIKR